MRSHIAFTFEGGTGDDGEPGSALYACQARITAPCFVLPLVPDSLYSWSSNIKGIKSLLPVCRTASSSRRLAPVMVPVLTP